MTVKPINRAATAMAEIAARHRMGLPRPVIWLLAGAAAEALAEVARPPVEIAPGTMPSPEELTVLRQIANGATSAHLSKVMHRTVGAIDQQLHRLCLRMGVGSVTQAVAVCLVRGWIRAEDVRVPAGVPRRKVGVKPAVTA